MKLKLEIFIYEPETESKKEGRKEGYLVEFICSRFNGEKCLSRICGEIRHKTEKSTKKCWGQTLFYYFCLVFFPALVYNLYQLGKNRNSVIYEQSGGTRNNPLTHRHSQTIRTTNSTY